VLSHVAGPSNFLGQTEAKARYSLLQSLARIWLQQNRIHRSYLEELLPSSALSRSPSRFAPCASRSSPTKHVTEPADHFAGGEMSWVTPLGPLRRVAQD